MKIKVTAIIMASGSSKRMGRDKLKLKIGEKKIYQYAIDLVANYDFFQKIIVSQDEEILSYAKDAGIEGYYNQDAYIGKSTSIKIGVNKSKDTDAYMFFVADQPYLTKETLDKILDAFKKNPESICYPIYGKKKGGPAVFPQKYKAALLSLEKDQGGSMLFDETSKGVIINKKREHIDIDTKEEYEEALRRWKEN